MQFFSLQRRIMHISNSLNHPFISIFKLCNHCTEQTIRIKDDVLSVLELLTNENVCNSCKCRFSLLILSLSISHFGNASHIFPAIWEPNYFNDLLQLQWNIVTFFLSFFLNPSFGSVEYLQFVPLNPQPTRLNAVSELIRTGCWKEFGQAIFRK